MSDTASGVQLRYLTMRGEWAAEMEALELASFPNVDPEDLYNEKDLLYLAEVFPEGAFVVFDSDQIVGMGLGVLTDFDFEHPNHSLSAIYSNHNPDGQWYYGTTIAVNPKFRGQGIGRKLYELRKDVVRRLNRRGIVAGGVLPGYADHIDKMTATQYIERVSAGKLYDPTLTFQIQNGFEARCVLANYLDDPTVGNNAVLIVWSNPDFDSEAAS